MKRLSKNTTLFALIAAVLLFVGCENLLQNDDEGSSSDGDGEESEDTTPPAEVEDLSASSGDGEVTLTWTDPSDSDFDHVEITGSPEDGGTQPKEVALGTESATITGLTNGTSYTFTVKTVDTAGNTSNGLEVVATPQAPNTDAPAEVSDLTVALGDGEVTLEWTDPTDSDFDHVKVSWTPEEGDPQPKEIGNGTETATITGLTNGTQYTFTVKTVDTADNTSNGTEIAATPVAPDTQAPAEVSNLSASEADGEVTLAWTDPSDSDFDHVEITWSPEDGDAQPKEIGSGTETATIGGLTNGTSYTFTVKTVDNVGNTSAGETITASPVVPGTKQWSYSTGGSVESSPAIGSNGTIYVGSGNYVYALNPDGTQKWSYSTGDRVRSSPAVASDGTIYVGSWDNNVYAINPDGTKKWSYSTGDSVLSSPAVSSNGTIYVGSTDNNVYAINPDGTEKWAFSTGADVHSSPAVGSNGTIYVGSNDIYVYALNPDGTMKWRYSTFGMVLSSPTIASDGTIYVGSNDDNVYALNPDGTMKWRFGTASSVETSPAVASDGTIYVSSIDHNVYALNPGVTYNREKWSYSTGHWVESSPAVTSDGTIYVGSYNGNVYALNGDSSGLADSPWPMFGRDLRHTSQAK